MGPVVIEFRRCNAAQPPARELLAAVLVEYDVIAGHRLTGGLIVTPSDFSPPDGAYLVGFSEDTPTCGGGVKALGASIAEVKRMYVLPRFRGRGLAQALLKALEDNARDLGHRTMRLDSAAATWPMYVAAGYREIPDYNNNPHADFWGEKGL
jgi:GNAT superfamily N-acetyltransferase